MRGDRTRIEQARRGENEGTGAHRCDNFCGGSKSLQPLKNSAVRFDRVDDTAGNQDEVVGPWIVDRGVDADPHPTSRAYRCVVEPDERHVERHRATGTLGHPIGHREHLERPAGIEHLDVVEQQNRNTSHFRLSCSWSKR